MADVIRTIKIDEDTYQRAKIAAIPKRLTVGKWIEQAIEEKLQQPA